MRANESSAECHNGHGLALKDLKQFEQATTEFKKALELEPGLTTAIYNAGMTYADWYEQSHSNDHKDRATRVPAEVRQQRRQPRTAASATSRPPTTSCTPSAARKRDRLSARSGAASALSGGSSRRIKGIEIGFGYVRDTFMWVSPACP